jgi:foldase protein PrsA
MIVNTIVPSKVLLFVLLSILSMSCGIEQQIQRNETTSTKLKHKSPIVALVGTKTIRRDDLWPALIELAGEEAVQDAINSLLIEEELKRRAMSISKNEMEEEWSLLWRANPTVSEEAMQKQLRERGIGVQRERQILWRNTALRKLIAGAVSITDERNRRMFEILHGPSYPTKIIVSSSLAKSNAALEKLQEGVSFSDVARNVSIGPQANQGGDAGYISLADPFWPEPIRKTITTLEIGTYSNPIFIGDRWVIVLVSDKPTTCDISFNEVEEEMKKLSALAQEQYLMQNKLEELQRKSTPTYFDKDLLRTLGSDVHDAQKSNRHQN